MASEPAVMVSSTYYDLQEIRQQLASFIEGNLGYRPLISESSTFPVEPDADTIENCRRRVERDADVLILIIGGRYGAIERTSGKSVTNLEYLAARSKGIPIFAFVEKKTLVLYDAWRVAASQAREALGSTVEDARVFEFIEKVRSTDSVWIHGFERASDITDALRRQFAYAMKRGFLLEARLSRRPDRNLLDSLSPNAFRLAVEQPNGWKGLLLAEVLSDEVGALHTLRREYDLRLSYRAELIPVADVADWLKARADEAKKLSEGASKLAQETATEALRGSSDAEGVRDIVFAARQVARVYKESMQWAQRVRNVSVPDERWMAVLEAFSKYSSDLVDKLGAWGPYIREEIQRALAVAASLPSDAPAVEVNIQLQVGIPADAQEEFRHAMREVRLAFGITDDDAGLENASRI